MDWIHVAEDRDKWRQLTFTFHKMLEKYLVPEGLLASQVGLKSMESVLVH
jgi:hypothetical protein